ncbi:MAG: glutamate formimidoyltransferase [Aggregatilineales bacterium]
MPLIECVPNFSEGRDRTIIQSLGDAIEAVQGVHLLDVSSDYDHHRTVMTFIGEPEPILEAAYQAIVTASTMIDLEKHQGVHPRIGATDVVPFIPLRDASLSDCVELAKTLGELVGDELGLPVYLYEAAATRSERQNLADVRRGGYEKLKEEIHLPHRKPDFGPATLGIAGACVIGARQPLIAFNAYLDTKDVNIAQEIATEIRESGGGLPFVKALGLLVNGQAQVSMNVIDFRQTSLFTIMSALHELVKKYNVTVTHTELVGLIPQSALVNTALSYLQLPIQSRELILESRIGAETGNFKEIPFE